MYINYNQLEILTHQSQLLNEYKTSEEGGVRITVNERVKNRQEYQESSAARKSRSNQFNLEEVVQEIIPLHANRMSPYYPRFINNSNNSRFQSKPKSLKEQLFDEQQKHKNIPQNQSQFRINQSRVIMQNGNYVICMSNIQGDSNKNNTKLMVNANSINSTKIRSIMQKKSFQLMKQQLLSNHQEDLKNFYTKQLQFLDEGNPKQIESVYELDQIKQDDIQKTIPKNEFTLLDKQPDIIRSEEKKVDNQKKEEIQRNEDNQQDQKVKKQMYEARSPVIMKTNINSKKFKPQQITLVSENDKIKMYNYFRHHYVSLLSTLNKKESYFENLKENKPMRMITESQGDRKWTQQQLKLRDEVLSKIKKLLSTKGKYKYRERFNFQNSNQLKSLNYDVKKRLGNYTTNTNKLTKCLSKDDLDDEEGSPTKKNKQLNLTIYQDLSQWKKRNNYNQDDKVYIVKGGYAIIKQGLEDRGWVENPDVYSPFFDFKWTTKLIDLDFASLDEQQIVNHFDNNLALTSKFGLCRSLKTLIWYEDCDIDTFYPRCYDLGDLSDFEDFIEDFKMNKAESILISFDRIQQEDNSLPIIEEQFNTSKLTKKVEIKQTIIQEDQNPLIVSIKLRMAIMIIRRKLTDIIESVEQIIFDNCLPVVAGDEWELIKDDIKKISSQKWGQKNQQLENENLPHFEDPLKLQQYYEPIVRDLIKQLKLKEPQFNLNGYRNIWILKPNFLSRGRGIKCFNQIEKILDHIIGKETQYVIQKYMENPIIIKQKKFDIRQWVIVQDYDPPRVWFFDECYIRFSAEEFDINNLSNRFIHLTNNSIAKNSGNFYQGDIKGNMWTQEEFANYLKDYVGEDIFYNSIQPMIKQIVILTVKSAQDQMKNRKNSMELFGYDFMIDEHMVPWLIEINSSPSMDYSTHVTQRLVPIVLEDTLKVTLDYTYAKKGTKKLVDTGMFKLIYKGDVKQQQI